MPKLNRALRSRIRVNLGIADDELDELVSVVGEADVVDFSKLLEGKLIRSHIPEVIRRPDAWLAGHSLLDVLRADGMKGILSYFDRLLSYVPECNYNVQNTVKRIFGTTDVLRIHDAILQRRIKSIALTRAMHMLDLDKKMLARVLSVSDATLNRRLRSKASLPKHEAECLYRLARIADLAASVFGDRHKTRSWLTHPIPALRGALPIDRLSTELSGREVEGVLYKLGLGGLS